MMKFKKSNQTQWEKNASSKSFHFLLPKNSGRKSLEPSLGWGLSSTCEGFPQLNPPLGLEKFQRRGKASANRGPKRFERLMVVPARCGFSELHVLMIQFWVQFCNFPQALFLRTHLRYTFPTPKAKSGKCAKMATHMCGSKTASTIEATPSTL